MLLVTIVLPNATRAGSLSGKDVQIIAKMLGFLDPPCTDGIVAVIYTAKDPASRADAAEIVKLFGSGLQAGNSIVRAEAAEAGGLVASTHYVAVIAAVGAPADIVMQVGRERRIPCITNDVSQVQANRCVIAVRSEPKVDIVLNHELAASTGVGFATAFRMLIHEI